MTRNDDHTPHPVEGLAADLPHFLTRRRIVAGLGLAGAGLTVWATRGGAEATLSATGADGAVCVKAPAETAGPFPADGTNAKAGQTVNILTETGVVREDIRGSIGGLTPVAEGVPLVLDLTLVDVGAACAPLAGHAVYVWQCDAEGVYSIYDAGDRNYLRGVGISDVAGRLRFTTVFPACYPGRWPHIHFEVFASAGAAVSGAASLLTSQFALPEAACAAVYAADPRYAASIAALQDVTLARDGVFRNNTAAQIAAQTLTLTGDPANGFLARGVIGITA